MNNGSAKHDQIIGCSVSECRHHGHDNCCELHRIEVRPCRGERTGSGKPEDESCCGSFVQR